MIKYYLMSLNTLVLGALFTYGLVIIFKSINSMFRIINIIWIITCYLLGALNNNNK